MNKEFSDALVAALKPAEEARRLLVQINANKNVVPLEGTKVSPEMVLIAVSKVKKGFKQSLVAVKSLVEHVQYGGDKPSGMHYNAVSEELFSEACDSGEWELAVYAAMDIVSVAFLEQLQELLRLAVVYTGEIEEAARLRNNGEVVSPVAGVDEVVESAATTLISADEVEARRATTA